MGQPPVSRVSPLSRGQPLSRGSAPVSRVSPCLAEHTGARESIFPAQTMDFSGPIPRVSFHSKGLAHLHGALLSHGVVIVTDVFSAEECLAHLHAIMGAASKLSRGVTPEGRPDFPLKGGLDPKQPSTWTPFNTPPGPTDGLYQWGPMSNSKALWDIRSDKRLHQIFCEALTLSPDEHLVSSIDGANIGAPPLKPRRVRRKPNYPLAEDDWAHFDQYTPCVPPHQNRGDTSKFSVQGQVVLTDSDGQFRVSPRSHLVHQEILDLNTDRKKPASKVKWEKLRDQDYEPAKKLVEGVGGTFQMKAGARPGDVILWLSATLHSATKVPHTPQLPRATEDNPYPGFRCVVFVSYCVPRDSGHVERLQRCFEELRCTNHSGSSMFSTDTGTTFKTPERNSGLARLVANPLRAREIPGLIPEFTTEIYKLLGCGIFPPLPESRKATSRKISLPRRKLTKPPKRLQPTLRQFFPLARTKF